MSLTLAYPSQLLSTITSLGSDGWLVGQTAAGVTGKLNPSGISIGDLASAASGGSSSMIWNASKVYLPTNGDIGYWDGSAWKSRLRFSSTDTSFYGPGLSLRNLTDSDDANLYALDVYASKLRISTNHYIYEYTTGVLGFWANGAGRAGFGTSGSFQPITDNVYALGTSSARWSAVWAANGTIQTSDARDKTAITDTDLGLDFILALHPVKFRWIIGGNRVTPAEEPDGDPTITAVPGVRTHYGLLAQEVKSALGETDFGGWIEDAETGQQGLRYDQFIAPLIKAIQELEARVAAMEVAR